MKDRYRTPQTLEEAIWNANDEYCHVACDWFKFESPDCPSLSSIIEKHVVDFISQKFGTAVLKAGSNEEQIKTLAELFEKIKAKNETEKAPDSSVKKTE